eukprot:587841-Pyramimonas_sp.AAC.1
MSPREACLSVSPADRVVGRPGELRDVSRGLFDGLFDSPCGCSGPLGCLEEALKARAGVPN